MDVIAVLKEDHKKVEALFKQLEEASDRAKKTKRRLFQQISTELSLHAAAEEAILYPRLQEMPDLRHCAFEAVEEHRLVKQLIAEIAALLDSGGQPMGQDGGGQGEVSDGMGPQWDAKVKVLIDMVRHHVREEEGEIFKDLRAELKRAELVELGEAILMFKKDPKAAPAPGADLGQDGGSERMGERAAQPDKSDPGEQGRRGGRSRSGVADQPSV